MFVFQKYDDKALKDVANYLDDHYALDVSQQTLEKIASMSGTKIKKNYSSKNISLVLRNILKEGV